MAHSLVSLMKLEKGYSKLAFLKKEMKDLIKQKKQLMKTGVPAEKQTVVAPSSPPNWRTVLPKTKEQYEFMQNCKILTDCKINVVSEDNRIVFTMSVHRLQLIRASPVFEAMLMDDMLEAKTGEITITDLSPIAVQRMIHFIYGDEVKLKTFEEACEVAFAAEKYQIKELRFISISVVLKLLSPGNVWIALSFANILQLKNLTENCIEMLQRKTLDCITCEEFLQTSEENLIILLEQEELNIVDELVLVNATINWARHEAQRRGLSGDDAGVRSVIEPNILRLLRLAIIPPKSFKTGPGIADWLTKLEKEDIMEYQEQENSLNLPEHLSSSKTQRQLTNPIGEYKKHKIHLCKRKVITTGDNLKPLSVVSECGECTSFFEFQGTQFEAISKCLHAVGAFRVKSKCRLLGFECPGQILNNIDPTMLRSKHRPSYNENMNIIVVDKGSSLSKSPAQAPLQVALEMRWTEKMEYNSTIPITFPHAVQLNENNWYMIFVIFYACDDNTQVEYPYCTRPKQVVSSSGVKFIFHTKNLPGYWTSLNDGIFKSFYVSK